ncbi:MAG: CDP-diacylglycerol-serine O-phosphatidyltransferase [Stictis urceolatum]|nr:CDP-diacylglycerol-serine O-phosphatidyltransferase [Stictis urceolata]
MSRRLGASDGGAKEAAPKDSQDKQKMLLSEDVGHFSMIKALHLADLITIGNCFCGFNSILSSMRYCLGAPDDFTPMWFALGFMPFGLFFDFMDGKVARWRKKSSLMGQELDSLADLVSFGVAPASASFALGLRTNLDILLLSFFVCCGLTRLARFNVTVATLPKDATGKSKFFEGTPIPTSLAIVGWMSYWVYSGTVLDQVPGGVLMAGTPFELHAVVGVFVAWGCAMVSRTIHIPKP